MGVTVQNWFYSLPPALPLIVTWTDLTIIYLQQMEHLTNAVWVHDGHLHLNNKEYNSDADLGGEASLAHFAHGTVCLMPGGDADTLYFYRVT